MTKSGRRYESPLHSPWVWLGIMLSLVIWIGLAVLLVGLFW
jgi:hypothetical protein